MKKVLFSILVCAACGNAYAHNCKPVQSKFLQYQESLKTNKSIAQYFSHSVLADQLDGLFIVKDDAEILHNAKATVRQLSLPSLATPFSTNISCNSKSATVTASFSQGNTKKILLKYVNENGGWYIDGIEVSVRPKANGI
jgi:hypothetical protein